MALLQLSENYREFLRLLNKEAPSLEVYETASTKPAIAALATDLRIAKFALKMVTPHSPLRTKAINHSSVLYENPAANLYAEPHQETFNLPDGGTVNMEIWSDGEPFGDDEKELLNLCTSQLFTQCSRIAMKQLLITATTTDFQTGAAKQEAFMQRVGFLLQKGQLSQYTGCFFNVHNFKYVNKVFSYAEGDLILRKYAKAVMGLLVEGEMMARLGGDNFLLMLYNDHAPAVFKSLKNIRLEHSNEKKSVEFVFGVTAGTAAFIDIHAPRDVMAKMSIAYAAARRSGPGSFMEYSPQLHQKIMTDQSVISNFESALSTGEFVAFYQPKVSISQRKVVGAEALVRWIRDGKVIPPMTFIPQLEKEGSICKLDFHMLELTCRFLRNRMNKGEAPIRISVNFSRRHLTESNLVQRIVSTIDTYNIPHEFIDIELTESDDFQNYAIMTGVIAALHAQGIRTSMDDFGTGFSSLNMIKQVNLDVIKIDRSLVPREEEYSGKSKDLLMFNSLAQMISQLGKGLVVEGVETPPQLEYLKNAGCDIVQGYIFDKPLPEADFEKRLQTGYLEK